MRFGVTEEQASFAEALDDLLAGADAPAANRAWAGGDHDPGRALWRRLAELGVTGLGVPERLGGLEASEADLVVAFEALGRHAVPGPWIESIALAPRLLTGNDAGSDARLDSVLESVAAGDSRITVALTGTTGPTHAAGARALDADVADEVFVLDGATLSRAQVGAARTSVDPARRLFDVVPGTPLATLDPEVVGRALNSASLAAAATALGAGERMLALSVEYVKARRQFGTVIGEYQSLKHLLADVRVALDFARPLVHLAALTLDAPAPASADADRDVSAAAVACAEAAQLSARTALQVHGAIGYTQECDLSLWLLKVRALRTAWGTPDHHRRRVLSALTAIPATRTARRD